MSTNRQYIFPAATCFVLLIALAAGCWPDDQPPTGTAPSCIPNGQPNGTCDEAESFWSCPKDCPACYAIQIVDKPVNVQNPAGALGPKGKSNGSATLGPNSTLVLWMGGGIWTGDDDAKSDSWDLQFEPQNTSEDLAGAFIVTILDMDSPEATYQSLGYWFKDEYSTINDKFDLKRAKIKKSDSYMIRIQGQAKSPTTKLDYVKVRPDRCRTKPN